MALSLRLPLFVLAASVGALGTALAAQYWGGLQPCILCLWQRVPYAVVIALAVVALLVRGPRTRGALVGLAGVAFLIGAGIAVFHVGVEQGWWHGTAQCGGQEATPDSIEALRAQLSAAPVARCTDVAWSFAGISMAGFNVLASLALAAVALLGARRLIGGRPA